VWAERFDHDTGDLIALQDEVTSRIAIALNIELVTAEAVRPTWNPDALDHILRARAELLKPHTRESYAAASSFLSARWRWTRYPLRRKAGSRQHSWVAS
jgi:hypothetical protein